MKTTRISSKAYASVYWMALLLCSWSALAQKAVPKVELSVNATEVKEGGIVRMSINFMNCKVKTIDPPSVPGLEWRMGPSTSSSTQWINGVTTSEQRYTYGYAVVGRGEVNIPAMVWQTNQGPLKTKPVRLLVTENTTSSPKVSKASQNRQNRPLNKDLMTSIEPTKRKVFLGEAIVINYRIYNRYNNMDVRSYDIPELEGFWKETIEAPEARWEPQLINGKRYNVATVRQIVAFPQQTGTFVLQGFDLKGYMRINFFEGRDIEATCDPVTIEVMPLPEEAPRNSLGTFGNLSVDQALSTDSLGTNEAVTLTVTYRGRGNLKFLSAPDIAWPAEFEVFDADIEDNIRFSEKGELGTRSFKFVAIPRAPGTYTLPLLKAVRFDPMKGRHVTSRAPSVTLTVGKGMQEGEGAAGMSFHHQQNVQVLNQDIRHIQLSPSRFIPRNATPWTFWGLLGLFLLGPGTFGFLAWRRSLQRAQTDDRTGTRRKKAYRTLGRSLRANPDDLTPEIVGEAMEQYLMAKLGWERSALTRAAVHHHLMKRDPQLAASWDELWEACELQRYGATAANTSEMAQRVLALAQTTEASWS
jgi:hypothetical protein